MTRAQSLRLTVIDVSSGIRAQGQSAADQNVRPLRPAGCALAHDLRIKAAVPARQRHRQPTQNQNDDRRNTVPDCPRFVRVRASSRVQPNQAAPRPRLAAFNAGSSAAPNTALNSLRIVSASAKPTSAVSAAVQTRRNRRPGRICAGRLPGSLSRNACSTVSSPSSANPLSFSHGHSWCSTSSLVWLPTRRSESLSSQHATYPSGAVEGRMCSRLSGDAVQYAMWGDGSTVHPRSIAAATRAEPSPWP
jgi:hypothetical protein